MQNEVNQVRPWAEVAGSEQFRALSPEHQERARELYYQDAVAPRVPKGMEQRARELFDQDTMIISQDIDLETGGQESNQSDGKSIITDAGNLLSGGVNRAAQNVRELVGRIPVIGEGILNAGDAVDSFIHGKDSETLLRENEKKYQGNLTQETQDAQAKLWWDSENKSLGPAWKDPRAYASGIIQSLPEMALTMGPSGRLAKAAYTRSLAKTGSKVMAAKAAAKTATIAGGIGEGLLGGADTARSVRDKINEMPLEKLANSEAFQSLIDEGMKPEDARRNLAEDSATQGMMIAGVATGIFGGLGDRALAKMLTGSIKGGVTSRVTKGAVSEGILEEFPQSMSQGLAENYAVQAADPTQELTEGVLNEGLGGLATGGVMGGGLGAMASPRTNQEPQPEPIDALETQEDATFKNTPDPLAIEAPGLQGLLPAPEQTFYADSEGTVQDIGPVRNVDGVMQPSPQSQQWVNPANRTDAPADLIGGAGMELQTPRGAPPGLEGQFIQGQEQQPMTPPASMGLTLDGNIERLGLPEPEAFVVDSEGNTQRGATAPQVFNESPMKGGAGMDQQAPTAPPKQHKSAPKAMPDEKSPQERAQYSWDSMNTFERNKAAQDTLGYADADMTEAAAKAWDQLTEQDQQKLTDAMDQDSGQRWDAPNQKISDKDRPVLQNRDRSTDASITQMQDIKNNPDYDRLSVSRDFGNGAPVVEPGADFPATQLGRSERTTTSTGRKIPVQYAVVEADQLLPSNDALGNSIPEYANGVEGKSRAIAGNGRVAGITAAWKSSKPVKAEAYKKQMIEDTQHGIDPKVIRAMKQPVLVRIMPLSEVSNNIGDESNVSGQAGLSPTEQANTDMRRIDLAELSLTEDNELSENTVLDFIKGMPKSELGTLLTNSGRPTPAAYARAEAALFQQAYQNEALTENLVDLKGDAKFIMNALMRAAPAMAKLEGAGIYDIRPLVSEAAEVAVNARRQGIKLSEFIKMSDFGRNPQVMPILEMMIESGQRTTAIGDKLINLAQMAYTEANKAGQDMFGEVDKQSPEALMKKAFDGEKANAQEIDGTPEALGDDGRSRPDASNAEGRASDGEGQPDSGAVQADQPAKPETAEARLKKKAAEKKDSTEPTTEKWRKNYLLAKKRATELGIDPKEHGKLPGLIKAIDAATADTRQTAPAQPEAEQAKVNPWGDRSFTLNMDDEYGPPPPHTKAYEAAKSAPKGSVTHGLTVRPSGKQWHNLYLSHGNGDFSSVSVGRDMPDNLTKLIEKGFSDYDKKQKKQEQAAKDKDAVSAKEAAIAKENNLVLGRELGTIIPNTGKQFKSAKIITDHGDGTFTLRGVQGNKQAELRELSASSIVRAVDRYNLNAGAEPTTEKWRKNYLLAKKRATELGIDPKEHGKLPGLVKAIDAAMAETANPALDLTQQTEETLAAEAERLEQLQKEEAAQKAKQKAAESKARERDADKARADEVVDDFQLGQPAEDAMSGMGDIFDTKQSEAKPASKSFQPAAELYGDQNADAPIPSGDWRTQVGGNEFRENKDGITVRKHDRTVHIRGATSIAANKKARELASQDIRELHHAASKEDQSDPFSEAAIWLDGDGNMIRKKGTKKPTGALASVLKQSAAKADNSKQAAPKAPTEAIEDFGEKIGGARKDVWDGFKDDLNKISDDQIASQPLSKIWPEPNYSAMIESGESPNTVALIRALREEITSKPRVKYKLTRWAESVREARSTANALLDGTLAADQFLSELRKSGTTLEGFAGRVELYSLVGHEKSLAKIYFAKHRYSLYRGEKDVTLWVVENNNTSGTFGGWPSQIATGKTKEQAIEAFKKAYSDMPEKGDKKAKQSFDIWSERGREGYLVGKKIGRHYAEFAGPFKTTKEAREYVINSEKELTDKLEKYREIPSERRDTERPRVGEDHRQGQDVTPEQFSEAFGFRGVEFGNWVEQGRRQADLNQAYDALMDMAAVLDVPAKAISLNGALSLAFGARGKGGKNAAKAHYEPGKVVINLSKRTGAGSLGHEWWHALDNYFSRERDSRTNYMTTERDVNLSSRSSNYHYADKRVRKEMVEAFGEVVKRINETALEARSRVLDNKRTKEYWTTTEEMSARAFESYLISKLQDNNAHNDYLANIVDESTWAAAEALGFEMDGSYPYPTAGEVPAIRAGFDHFFNTIESRETDSGVQLYKTGSKNNAAGIKAEAITDALASTPELAGVKVVQSFDDLPKSVRDRAKRDGVEPGDLRGIYSGGSTYVVADNHANVAEAVYTAVHEEVGHRGIRDMLGGKLTPTMERIYSSYAATAKGRKLIKDIREDYASVLKGMDAAKQRQVIAEELVAYAVQDGKRPTVIQRYISKVRELLRALFPQVSWTNTDILALGEQSRQWLRSAQDGTASSDSMYALRSKPKNTSEQFTDLTDKQKEALNKIAPVTTKQRAIDWIKEKSDRGLLKIRQGIVDRYASLRKLDEAVYGDDFLKTDITQSAWVLARMASSASGALHAMLNNGRIYLDPKQKVLDLQDGDALGLNATLARLGTPAEIERFMGWIAGNRSAKLATEGRENLFDAAEIEALRTLNRGTTEGNKDRGALYAEVFDEFQQYRDDVLAIAEQAGIITPENRAMWRDEFYVPFYRVMEEEKSAGPMPAKGLSRQEAYKKLKGGKQNLNDLLQNTVLNFNHLLAASMNNQAAAQALDNAAALGIATATTESARDTKASTYVLKAGVKQWYNIDDPLVFEALNAISDSGLNGAAIKAMSFLKRMFTNAITVTPQFIVANLLRDAMSATATSPVSKNFMKNIVTGGMAWTDSRQRARMLASGGAFSFGHIYSNDPHEMKAHLTRNLRSANIMDGTKLIPQALKAGWDHWNALATAAENSNRTAIFQQTEQRDGKLSAAFEARDLTDFSAHGAWPAMRFLIRVIPFLNARIQGNDKLYRAGLKPAVLTAFGKGTTSDKQSAKRFLAVTTAISMASMALMLVNNDDEEYRRLEEWQKDTYWFVRVGSKAFFIPKPFEVGTIATMTERLLQQAIDDKATGQLFRQRVGHALTETFSFSVVPHAFQPLLEVYANQDSFTQRPIESMGMERLSKGLRSRSSTTAPAHLVSKASRVLGDDFPLAVSPVQADHLIAGYFGQVGAWGAGIADTIWRSANGETEPAKHWHEYQPIRRFYKDLDVPSAYTRYSTLFYEGLREAGKAYADVQELQKIDRMDDARKVVDEKRDVLQMRTQLNKVQRQLTKINNRMNMIRISKIDSDSKRRELDRLTVIKARLTEQAGKQVEEMKAKR